MLKGYIVLATYLLLGLGAEVALAAEGPAVEPQVARRKTVFAASPLYGWNRNAIVLRDSRGQTTTATETAPMYGLFFMLAHRNVVLTDFAFFTDVNDTDIEGNLAFANLYGRRPSRLTWNVGAGHLYHRIRPPNESITIHAPMAKAGALIGIPEWRLTLNPYVGHVWERIETRRSDRNNDALLFGLTVGWRWRMLAAAVQYYYQDGSEANESYHTVRARLQGMASEHWGAVLRFDYMEHVVSDDTSVLLGPVLVF